MLVQNIIMHKKFQEFEQTLNIFSHIYLGFLKNSHMFTNLLKKLIFLLLKQDSSNFNA
jgi:hypothetical protein